MKLYCRSLALIAGISCYTIRITDATNNQNRFCDLWNDKDYDFDMVAVTDDKSYGEGRNEDMALVRAMRKLGRKATRISIQDDDFDWRSTKMVTIRSAWYKYSYREYYQTFIEEINQVAILMNPLPVLKWQSNKDVYFKDLMAAGINIPETIFVSFDDIKDRVEPLFDDEDKLDKEWQAIVDEIQKSLGCENIVMKPSKGNGGVSVRLYPDDPDFLNEMEIILVDEGDSLLFQCYQDHIETKGERGIIFVGGEVSHGLMKMPDIETGGWIVNEDFGGQWSIYDPSPEEVQFAKEVAAAVKKSVGEWPAYLRVDVFNDNNDNLALMELAAGTALLWMAHKPEAADLLASYFDKYLSEREAECTEINGNDQHAKVKNESLDCQASDEECVLPYGADVE